MPNQDIITALSNAVEHGETLELAMQVIINSGYNPAEVQEASRFVMGGVVPKMQSDSGEDLLAPEEKSFFKRMNFFNKKIERDKFSTSERTSVPSSVQQQPRQIQPLQSYSQRPLPLQQPRQLLPQQSQILRQGQLPVRPPQKIQSVKKSYFKEIILLIILLLLIGVLIGTIIFRDNILRFFSG